MRINWFSPLPPARTEVANYTARLFPFLSRHAELTLWSDQPRRELTTDLGAAVRQFNADVPPWEELNTADMNVYHLGNNARWHAGIWQLSRQAPGLVVLHEARLPQLLASDSTRLAAASNALPAELATRDALGVVAHNRDAFERLRESGSVSVLYAPLQCAEQGLAGRSALESDHDARSYAECLVEFAARCGRDRGRAAFRQVTRRAAAKLIHAAGSRSAALGFDAIAAHVSALGRDPTRTAESTGTPVPSEPLRKAA